MSSADRLVDGARLWDGEAMVAYLRRWLDGDGNDFLQLTGSQVAAMHSTVTHAKDSRTFKAYLEKFMKEAKDRGKGRSYWARNGGTLIAVLDTAVKAAAENLKKPENESFLGICQDSRPEPLLEGQLKESRDFAIRREALSALVKMYRARKYRPVSEERGPKL